MSAETTCDCNDLRSFGVEAEFEDEKEIVSIKRGWSSGSSIEDWPVVCWAADTMIASSRGWSSGWVVHAEAEHESEEGPVSVESIESSFIIKGCSSLDFKAKADLSMPDLRAASSLSMSTATAYQVAIEQTLNKGYQGHCSSDFVRRQQKFD